MVGGGLAGLFTAWSLVEEGVDEVVVLEAAAHPGGIARTIERDGYLLEPAVGSMIVPHPDLTPILEGVGTATIPARLPVEGRYVWSGQGLVALVAGPGLLLSPLASARAKGRGLVEATVREPANRDDESLEAFLVRRLGQGLGATASWLAASGAFAGDPGELSARSAFPSLVAAVEDTGSLTRAALSAWRRRRRGHQKRQIHVPAVSVSGLADAVAAALGPRFRPGLGVETVRQNGRRWKVEGDATFDVETVVLACNPLSARSVLDGPIADSLAWARHAPVVVVWLGGSEDDLALPEGYGILTTRPPELATRGVLLESSYAPHRAPPGHALVKVIAGGLPDPGIVAMDDDRVVEKVVSELSQIVNADLSPQFTEVVRHRPGIPQYGVGHEDWLRHLARSSPDGLFLTGWGYRGVGIAQLATDARRLAAGVVG